MSQAEEQADLAVREYIREIKASLPAGAGIAETEAEMVKRNPQLLQERLQSL